MIFFLSLIGVLAAVAVYATGTTVGNSLMVKLGIICAGVLVVVCICTAVWGGGLKKVPYRDPYANWNDRVQIYQGAEIIVDEMARGRSLYRQNHFSGDVTLSYVRSPDLKARSFHVSPNATIVIEKKAQAKQ